MTAAAYKPDNSSVADLRRQLIENGYTPVPVITGDKMPKLPNWQKLTPETHDVDGLLVDHPDHLSTGLLTGELVAIDVDVLDEAVAAEITDLVAAIPGAENTLVRQGHAPKVLFLFRATEPAAKQSTTVYLINGKKCQIEVMGEGQQIVAFGIHPVTGRDYEWLSGTPLEIPLHEIAEISPELISQFLRDAEAVLARHGEPIRKPAPARSAGTAGGETFWTRVNAAALENADRWVPSLFRTAHKEPGTGAWRVSSSDLGRPLEEDISIHSTGIRDFGEEGGETPISLVMKWGSASIPKDAAMWLCRQIGVDPLSLGWDSRPAAFALAHVPLIAANDNEPDDEAAHTPLPATAGGLPLDLCYPPGAVGDFARWIASCARFPSPHLALVASLAFVAALVGRRYKGPTGLRSNLYIVGLAESGFGKDITIRATARLADSTPRGTAVSKKLFMDEVRSLPGLAAALRRAPSSVTVIDEFGKWLGLHTGKRVASFREEVATAIMALTGAPSGHWGGQEKGAGNIPRIEQPCFSIHGVTTPSTFWEALSSGTISEGLLGRLVLIDASGTEPKKVRRPAGDIESVPPALAEKVHALLGGGYGKFSGGPFYALDANSEEPPWPIQTVEYAEGVEDIFESFDDRMRARKASISPDYRPILNRVGENAARLALIVAIGVDHKDPVITREIQEWANAVAEHSFNTMIRGADENIADNEKSAEYLRVRRIIQRRGESGITLKMVTRTVRGALDSRRLDDILGALRRAGEVSLATRRAESGQVMMRFWSADHLPNDAEIVVPS